MKKKLMTLASATLTASMLLTACGGGATAATTAAATTAAATEAATEAATTAAAEVATEAAAELAELNIMFVVTGSLGGGTNNDDVYAALKDYTDANGGNVSTFECNMDTSLYESTLMQAAEMGEYDLIVTGFGTMIEPLGNTAAKYPDQKFFIFDTEMNFADGKNSNVMSVQVLQNQGYFLTGALAALLTTSGAEYANDAKTVGFVGAMESTAVLDALVSYIEGVKYVDPSIEVLYSFVGDHNDSALTKEMALAQNNSGADVILGVTNSDLAVADAALEKGFYAMCADADEATKIAATSKETAEHIVTSVIKAYYNMVSPIVEEVGAGTAEWGTHSKIPYADGGVTLADNEFYQALVPEEIRTQLTEIAEKMIAGEIEVSTAYGASTEDIDALKALAAAQ
ncbi:MAG: BMP family ABC transporter substrate-binding protein [Lachnoclostridium sp.]|nr:BMP family ABC transporter substrate-binding protein [Lachnoclostridium sp.]